MASGAPALEPFSRWLRWALLGPYGVLFGGAIVVGIINSFPRGSYYTGYFLPLAVAVAILVQLVAVFRAITLLAPNPRYRSWMNIALTVAGVIPSTYLVLIAMIFGIRFHM